MAAPQNLAIDLCTVADVVSYIGGGVGADGLDELQQLVTAISQAAATYCATNFIQATYTETCNGTGTGMLLPHNQPITAVASISVCGHALSPGVGGGQSGFVFDTECLYLLGGARFPRDLQNVVVVYTAGFTNLAASVCTIPYDLRQAVVEAVADRFKRRQNIGIVSKTIAGETITYSAKDFPQSSKFIFNLYQKVSFG